MESAWDHLVSCRLGVPSQLALLGPLRKLEQRDRSACDVWTIYQGPVCRKCYADRERRPASHIGKGAGHTSPAQDVNRLQPWLPHRQVWTAAGSNRQSKQPVSTMTRGSSQEGSQLKRTIKAGLNLGAVICDDGAIPKCLFGRKLIRRCAKPGRPIQVSMPVKKWHSGLPEQSVRIKAWRYKVLAADARKAGSASDATRLTPIHPSLTGKEVWSHW